jgi:hypothetical protein
MGHLRVNEVPKIYSVLIFVHYLLLMYIVFAKLVMVRVMMQTDVMMGQEESIYLTILRKKSVIILFYVYLLCVSMFSFTNPSMAALSLFQIYLFRSKRGFFLIELFKRLWKGYFLTFLFVTVLLYFMAIVINP